MNELENYLHEQINNHDLVQAIMTRVEDLVFEAEERGYNADLD